MDTDRGPDDPCERCHQAGLDCYRERNSKKNICSRCRARKVKCVEMTPDKAKPRKTRGQVKREAGDDTDYDAIDDDDEDAADERAGNFTTREALNLIHHDLRLMNYMFMARQGWLPVSAVQPWVDDHHASYGEWSASRDPGWTGVARPTSDTPASPVAGPSQPRREATPSVQSDDVHMEEPPAPEVEEEIKVDAEVEEFQLPSE